MMDRIKTSESGTFMQNEERVFPLSSKIISEAQSEKSAAKFKLITGIVLLAIFLIIVVLFYLYVFNIIFPTNNDSYYFSYEYSRVFEERISTGWLWFSFAFGFLIVGLIFLPLGISSLSKSSRKVGGLLKCKLVVSTQGVSGVRYMESTWVTKTFRYTHQQIISMDVSGSKLIIDSGSRTETMKSLDNAREAFQYINEMRRQLGLPLFHEKEMTYSHYKQQRPPQQVIYPQKQCTAMQRICAGCGVQVADGAVFCPKCGQRQS